MAFTMQSDWIYITGQGTTWWWGDGWSEKPRIDRVREPTVKRFCEGLSQYANPCLWRLLLRLLVGPQAGGLHPLHFVDKIMNLTFSINYQSNVETTEYSDWGYSTENPRFNLIKFIERVQYERLEFGFCVAANGMTPVVRVTNIGRQQSSSCM